MLTNLPLLPPPGIHKHFRQRQIWKASLSHSPFSTHYLAALISAVHLIIRLLKHATEARCYKAKRPFLHVIAVDSKLFMTFNPHEYSIGEFLIISKAFERLKFASAHCPCFEMLALVMPACPVEVIELVVCQSCSSSIRLFSHRQRPVALLSDYQINKTPLPALQVSVIALAIARTANESVEIPLGQNNHPFSMSLTCLVHHGDLIHDLGPRKPRRVQAFQCPGCALPPLLSCLDALQAQKQTLRCSPFYRFGKLWVFTPLESAPKTL